ATASWPARSSQPDFGDRAKPAGLLHDHRLLDPVAKNRHTCLPSRWRDRRCGGHPLRAAERPGLRHTRRSGGGSARRTGRLPDRGRRPRHYRADARCGGGGGGDGRDACRSVVAAAPGGARRGARSGDLIRSIEGLRGVAALLVALFHAYVYNRWGGFPAHSKVLQHAWLFVDLFFVISGFVMATVYSERLETPRSAWAYMVRRFYRLYPLHVVTTAAALLAVVAVQTAKLVLANLGITVGAEPPFGVKFFDLGLLVAEMLLLQGLGIIRMELHNYPSWSISVEFWLYALFALMTLVLRSR